MRSSSILLSLALTFAACSDGKQPISAPINARIAGAIDLGTVAPGTEFDFVLGVGSHRIAEVQRFLERQVLTGDMLSPDDYGDMFAVSPGQYGHIVTWLQSQGLLVTRTTPSRTTISVHGTAEVIQRVFATEIHAFDDSSGRFSAIISGLQLAPELNGVDGVVGLNGGSPWGSHVYQPDLSNLAAATYGAPQIETQYGTSAITMPGMGESVAILGAGLAPPTTDLTKYVSTSKPYGLTTFPGTYKQEFIGGMNRDPQTSAQGEQLENALDVEMVAAMAPYATIYHVLTATNFPGLFTDGISYIVNAHNTVHAVSVSYGSCERGAAGEMPVLNALFAQAKAEGQTWFFAAGDSGTDGCRDSDPNSGGTLGSNKILSAGWPASSPSVIGVGGTQINTGTTEVVWNTNGTANPGAGGGGPSESLDKPAYQVGATPNDGSRDEPDVAALSGPPYISIVVNGAANGVGGTSAATPIWAGAWALIEQAKNHVGISQAQEKLYAVGKLGAGKGFNDVTSGNNGGPGDQATGGWPAAAGYDLATGWGTPNVSLLITNLQ